jgi:hypothetical protein
LIGRYLATSGQMGLFQRASDLVTYRLRHAVTNIDALSRPGPLTMTSSVTCSNSAAESGGERQDDRRRDVLRRLQATLRISSVLCHGA